MKKLLIFLITFFSIVAIFTTSAYCGFLYITPSSYISLNGNPSIKYSINVYGRVLNVETNNEKDDIIYDLNLNNMKISDAIQETVDKLVSSGYISQYNNSGLIISVSNPDKNKADRLMKKLNEEIQSYIEKSGNKKLTVETKINNN